MALDRSRVKVGLEMIAAVLPIHDPDDLEQMSATLHGIPWGQVAFALSTDIFNAADRHPDGWATFDDYLTFLEECVAFMRGARHFPDAIAEEEELAQMFKNRLEMIRRAFAKKEKKAEAKK